MTPTQLARLLALPLHWRRKLAGCEGPGWWVDWEGKIRRVSRPPKYRDLYHPSWAWAPCNPLEWLRVATPEGGSIDLTDGGTVWIVADAMHRVIATSTDPIDAALSAMQARP